MHTVTKVLVVFVAVLCVLLSALTMSYAVNAERIRSDYENEVLRRVTAEATAKESVSAEKAKNAELQLLVEGLTKAMADTQAKIRDLENERSQLRGEVTQAGLSRDAIIAQVDQLSATVKTQVELIENYRLETGRLRDNELRFRKTELELTDRNNELESQLEVLGQTVRAQQEQIAEMQIALGQAQESGAVASTKSRPTGEFVAGTMIRGRVLRTEADPGSDATLVHMNIGTNDRVREQMRMSISRDGSWIGDVVVVRTDLNWSVGKVVLTKDKVVDVRQDDLVLSRLR